MSERRYSKEHEWIRVEGDTGTVGITDYAQGQLGDVVYVELPDPGKKVARGAQAAVVESVKAASEVYSPVGGEVTAVNADLAGNPALVNESAEDRGWFFKLTIADRADLAALMDEPAYKKFVAELG
ncbi:MAG: glycine cleavage system protein GcvH [Alphaproteobacteria bacterium]|nr:glycine cleavage system protein GcvH [Alphaproteobacteria bacterium]